MEFSKHQYRVYQPLPIPQGSARFSQAMRCRLKSPPFAGSINFDAELWAVYVGEHSLERAADAYEWFHLDDPVAVMALPFKRSPLEFNWPVKGRTIGISSKGECSEDVYLLGHALILCGASSVYGVVLDELTIWKQPVEKGLAA